MISLNNEPCCACGQTRSLLVQETTYPEHRYPGSFCLRRCSGCGLLFNSPRLDDDELARLYGQNYYFFNRADSRELARIPAMYARTVALVADRVSPKTILDVGCGRGYLPAVLSRLGWDAHAVEISPGAAAYARRRFALANVFTGTVEQYARSNVARTFPLVTAIDVIEHVPRPDEFVAALARVVEPAGWLIVDTPNGAAHNIRTEGDSWKGFNPFHVFLFSISNLSRLLEKHGFSVEQSFSYGDGAGDWTGKPLPRKVRDGAIAAARSMRVIGPLARAYFKLQALSASRGELPAHLNRAARAVEKTRPYRDATDGRSPREANETGDNLVIVARRTA
jgi:2-polyprenyl-3-methyl-5-hydroxy-6-metoxy-1,4-benzoquinol methylase